MIKYAKEFKSKTISAALLSAITGTFFLYLTEIAIKLVCPGNVSYWLINLENSNSNLNDQNANQRPIGNEPEIGTVTQNRSFSRHFFRFVYIGLNCYITTSVLAKRSTSFAFTGLAESEKGLKKDRHNLKSHGLLKKLDKLVLSNFFFSLLIITNLATNNLPFYINGSVNEIKIIVIFYTAIFTYFYSRKLKQAGADAGAGTASISSSTGKSGFFQPVSLLEQSVNTTSYSIHPIEQLLKQPLIKGLQTSIKALIYFYLFFLTRPVFNYSRLAVNSVLFCKDANHLQFGIIKGGLLGFIPIVVALGSRMVLAGMSWVFINESMIAIVRYFHLSLANFKNVDFSNKSFESNDEFESQLSRSELQKFLTSNSSKISFLFDVSGAPKEPKIWNKLVGTIIRNLQEFNSKTFKNMVTTGQINNDGKNGPHRNVTAGDQNANLRKRTLPENINPKPVNFDDSDAIASKIFSENDQTLNVKVYSVTGQPRILSSTMLKPSEVSALNVAGSASGQQPTDAGSGAASGNGNGSTSDVKKSSADKIIEKCDIVIKLVIEKSKHVSEKLHEKLDYLLGIEDLDRKVAVDLKNANANANGQNVNGMTTRNASVSFSQPSHSVNGGNASTSLFAACQNVELLGLLAVAVKNFDSNSAVSFKSNYPIYSLLEVLFKLLTDIESIDGAEAASVKSTNFVNRGLQKQNASYNYGIGGNNQNYSENGNNFNLHKSMSTIMNNHGLAMLHENICNSIMKIVITFSDVIENDFSRVELRPFREKYQKILSN